MDLNGYLLDTCTISVAMRPTDARWANVNAHLKRAVVGGDKILVPCLASAEIEFGLATARRPLSDAAAKQHDEIRKFIQGYRHYPFDGGTVVPYALIRAELWNQLCARDHKGRFKTKHPEQLQRVSGVDLGIDEKDLLITGVAIQFNFKLATVDDNAGMQAIKDAAKALERRGELAALDVEDWALQI